ncbi:MAG: hypothetical protein J6J19_05095 [Oscillospiraceae bacterium]|nr:hypothetical protein [Oscillospiraceae bacterium]
MKKPLTVLLALVLVIAMSVAGTMAYLTSDATVTNTFTVGKVAITMDEKDTDNDDNRDDNVTMPDNTVRDKANAYKLIPGVTYTKDPIIHVDSLSEDCYLFVKVVNGIKDYEAAGATTIAAQMAAKGWKLVDETNGIYVYAENTANKTVVSAGSNITVFESFKIADNANITASGSALDVVVTAYAVQAEGFAEKTPAQIWTAANFT